MSKDPFSKMIDHAAEAQRIFSEIKVPKMNEQTIRKETLPVLCMGHCLVYKTYVDEKEMLISTPWTTEDVAESLGWTATKNKRFSMDGKTTVWLCPDCSKRWAKERTERLAEIMQLGGKVKTEREYWNLIGELQDLEATEQEKQKFSELLWTAL